MDEVTARTISELPPKLGRIVNRIVEDDQLNEGVLAMMGRHTEFHTPRAALFSGIYQVPPARRLFDQALDDMWQKNGVPRVMQDEVIVGGGLHAAIYASVRQQKGFPPPLVIEQGRPGGVFACSLEPSFYLNSRNRPGLLPGLPGEGLGLNVLPGCPVQPSDLSAAEFQTNTEMAFCVRVALACHARVVTGRQVTSVNGYKDYRKGRYPDYRYAILRVDNRTLRTYRAVLSTGLGQPNILATGDRILSFPQLMGMMDRPFPLRGMGRVALIGKGDSARTAAEALFGQGPGQHMSVPSLDWVNKLHWYGLLDGDYLISNKRGFLDCTRPRYRGLARFMPVDPGGEARIQPMRKAGRIIQANDLVSVDGRRYDYAIVCTGNEPTAYTANYVYALDGDYRSGTKNPDYPIYTVGPAAQLERGESEANALPEAARTKENDVAIFRYAPRTAALAASLR